MSNNLNSGHATNVANLSKFIQIIDSLGSAYNPSNNAISVVELKKLETLAQVKILEVNTALTAWKNATNAREIAYANLPEFATRLQSYLGSMQVPQQTLDDMAALVKKLRSSGKLTKADAGKTSPNADAAATTNPAPATHSTAKLSFTDKLDTFSQIVLLLQNEPLYLPNESVFEIANLQTKLNDLKSLNTSANESNVSLKAARIGRNDFLYEQKNGVLPLIKQAKNYIKSLKGANSEFYDSVKAIKFAKITTVTKPA